MTRKDYIAMANILSDATLHLPDAKRNALASRMASYFEQNNPRFKREVFYAACGMKSGEDY